MIYHVSNYRHTVAPLVKYWCDSKGGAPESHVSDLALASSAPIIVVASLIKELYGTTETLDKLIDRLCLFYDAKVEE